MTSFKNFLKKQGIKHEMTTPYTPEQNGVAERMNRTLTEKAKCFLFDANLPKTYWAEAINMAAYIVNRLPHSKSKDNKTPEEVFSGKPNDLSELKLFGTKVMVLKPKAKRNKWDENSTKMVFVGYDSCVKGYRCINTLNRKMTISRNVKFFESNQIASKKMNQYTDSSDESDTEQEANEETDGNESEHSEETVTAASPSRNDSSVDSVQDGVQEETMIETDIDDSIADPNFQTSADVNNGQRSSSRTKTQYQPFQIGLCAFIA